MKDSLPNMDEVVRQVKEALGNATAGPWADNVFEPYTTVYSYDHLTEEPDGIIAKCEHEPDAHLIANAPEWLRLLIEEREQLKSENDQLGELFNAKTEKVEELLNKSEELADKVAEQDKELQLAMAAIKQIVTIYGYPNNDTAAKDMFQVANKYLEQIK